MRDYRGYVAEATVANVFFFKDGEVHTPLPDCFLNGITRQTIIDIISFFSILEFQSLIFSQRTNKKVVGGKKEVLHDKEVRKILIPQIISSIKNKDDLLGQQILNMIILDSITITTMDRMPQQITIRHKVEVVF